MISPDAVLTWLFSRIPRFGSPRHPISEEREYVTDTMRFAWE